MYMLKYFQLHFVLINILSFRMLSDMFPSNLELYINTGCVKKKNIVLHKNLSVGKLVSYKGAFTYQQEIKWESLEKFKVLVICSQPHDVYLIY